jgi:hypothetical protein
MKILFAVMSAEHYIFNGMDTLIRDTWGKDAAQYGDFRFFCGRGDTVLPGDYVRVDAPDDKGNLIFKVEAMCLWAYERGYDMMLKVDADTYVNIPLIMKQDLNYDWIGIPLGRLGEMYGDTGAWSWIQGSAMWLSAKAMFTVWKDAVINMFHVEHSLMKANGIISPYPHSEDLWIGQVLGPKIKSWELQACPDTRYSNGPLTYHFAICHSTCTQEEWMERLAHWFSHLNQGNYAYHQSR